MNVSRDIIKTHKYIYVYKSKKTDIILMMPNVETNCRLKVIFQRVVYHRGTKWLIHIIKHHKGNQLRTDN